MTDVSSFVVHENAKLQCVFFWRRLLARSIDLIFTIPIFLVLNLAEFILTNALSSIASFSYMMSFFVEYIIGHILLLASIVIYDGCFLATLGTTIGKSLLGIRVLQANGTKLQFLQAISRTERMLRSHFYLLGFPIITSFLSWRIFLNIKRTGSSPWDDKLGSVISVRQVGIARLILFGCVGFIALFFVVISSHINKEKTKKELRNEIISSFKKEFDAQKNPPITYDPIRYESWETVSVKGICTFQIPPSMELQSGKHKMVMDQINSQVYQITTSENKVVAQQKGLNSFDKKAKELYARVIVETNIKTDGYFYAFGEPLALSNSELLEFDNTMKSSVVTELSQLTSRGLQSRLTSWEGTRIVRVNNIDCLLTKYSRSINNAPPANVRLYKFMNNDRIHTVTVSYRITESDLWAADLDKIITTFQFIKK